MKTTRNIIFDAIGTAIGVVIAVVTMVLLYRGASYLPCIENWLSPVVAIQGERAFTRDQERACFSLDLEKRAEATPIKYEFFAEVPRLSPPLAIAVETVDAKTNEPLRGSFEKHEVGTRWTRRYCFDAAATGIADDQPIAISGRVLHRRHPVYLSETPIPAFTIPPIRLSGP